MTSTRSLSTNTKTRSTTRRIESFRQRFGDGHFYLACHAALPLALTPDFLYSLWANFQRDIHGEAIEIPWIAVADLMLSNLCKEVGNELYEIDALIRNELITQLQNDSRFGLERVRELADFVMAYVEQQLDNPDLDVRDLATGQQWRALAYKNPSEAAHNIASVLAQLPLNDKAEWIRMAALTNSLSEPLSAFQSLIDYTQAMAALARGNLETATVQMSKAVDANNQVRVEGVKLPIPDVLNKELPQSTEQEKTTASSPNKFVKPIAIAGGAIISLLLLIAVQSRWRLPNPQLTPISSATPTPPTSSATPVPQRSPSPSPTSSPSPSPTLPQSTQSPQTPPVISQSSVASQPKTTASPVSSPTPATAWARSNPNVQSSTAPSTPIDLRPAPAPSPEPLPTDVPQTITVKRFEVLGSTVLKPEELAQVTAPYTNRPITLKELYQARDAVTKYYVDRGYVTSGALVPKQALSEGVVVIQVVEGSLERIDVEGTQNVDPNYILQAVQKGVSVPLNPNDLEAQLQALRADPKFTKVEATLKAGTQPGQSILVVRVTEADTSVTGADTSGGIFLPPKMPRPDTQRGPAQR